MDYINLKLWKRLLTIASLCFLVQISLLTIGLIINDKLNYFVLLWCILWGGWSLYCIYKLAKIKEKRNKETQQKIKSIIIGTSNFIRNQE